MDGIQKAAIKEIVQNDQFPASFILCAYLVNRKYFFSIRNNWIRIWVIDSYAYRKDQKHARKNIYWTEVGLITCLKSINSLFDQIENWRKNNLP